MPEDIKCINSWKKVMPEYELVLWDKNKFNTAQVPFVKEACHVQKMENTESLPAAIGIQAAILGGIKTSCRN